MHSARDDHPGIVEAEYLAALTETCDPDRWRKICERAVLDAENGCQRSRKWLSDLLVGSHRGAGTMAGSPDERTPDERARSIEQAIRTELTRREVDVDSENRRAALMRRREAAGVDTEAELKKMLDDT